MHAFQSSPLKQAGCGISWVSHHAAEAQSLVVDLAFAGVMLLSFGHWLLHIMYVNKIGKMETRDYVLVHNIFIHSSSDWCRLS